MIDCSVLSTITKKKTLFVLRMFVCTVVHLLVHTQNKNKKHKQIPMNKTNNSGLVYRINFTWKCLCVSIPTFNAHFLRDNNGQVYDRLFLHCFFIGSHICKLFDPLRLHQTLVNFLCYVNSFCFHSLYAVFNIWCAPQVYPQNPYAPFKKKQELAKNKF